MADDDNNIAPDTDQVSDDEYYNRLKGPGASDKEDDVQDKAEDAEDEDDDGDEEEAREAASGPFDVPDRIPVRFMTAGYGNQRDGHYYEPQAVQALVPEIKKHPMMFLDHDRPSVTRERGHRSLRDLAGIAVKESVHYDPMTQSCQGEVVLHPNFRDYIRTARLASENIGVSVDAIGNFMPGTKKCVGWKHFNSADFVPRGGAGGFTLPIREADSLTPAQREEEKQFAMLALQNMTPAEVKESAPQLVEAIVAEFAPVRETAGASPPADPEKVVRESTAYQSVVRENQALAARLDEMEAERNREQTRVFVDKAIRESGELSAEQVAYLARSFDGATVGDKGSYQTVDALASAVRETASAYLATLPKGTPSGEISGLGGRAGAPGAQGQSGYTNPMDINKSINEGLLLSIWGRDAANVRVPEQAPAQ